MTKFFKKRILGVPVFVVLLFAVAGVALAVWVGIARLESNILGSRGVSLEVSTDNATWQPILTSVFDNATMDLGENVTGEWYLKSSEPPANMVMTIENLEYIEGPVQGAVSGEKIYNYMTLYNFSSSSVDLRTYVDDCDGYPGGTFGDLICNTSPIPYFDQARYELVIQLPADVVNIDELNSDGFTFDVSFQPEMP